jgi:hypothetical protein
MEFRLPLWDVLLNLWLDYAGLAWLECERHDLQRIVNIHGKVNAMALVHWMKV